MHVGTLLLLASLPSAAGDDARDLVYLGEARPYRIRLHLRHDGRPAYSDFDEAFDRLFRYLDADGDGALDAAELGRAPSPQQFLQMMQGRWIEPAPAPSFEDLGADPKAAKATPAQLRAYYQRNGAGPLLVEWGWRTDGPDRLTNALFTRLDNDGDDKLSRAELAAAESVLRPLDRDRDELVSAGELEPNFGVPYTFRAQIDRNGAPPPVPFLVAPAGGPAGPVVRELLRRYDRDGDKKLSRSEIALEKDLFTRLDADGDGSLDEKELAAWLDEPPDAELIVEMGRAADQDVTLAPRQGAPAGVAVRRAPSGGLMFGLPDSQIEVFRVADSDGAAPGMSRYAGLFRAADSNGDGVLDSKEIFRDPFDLVGVLRVADRDGDGRLTEKEFTDYLEMQKSLASHFTLLTIADRGRSLFDFLDENHDGRLGVRELRTAWSRLAPFDRGGGPVGRKDVPRQFHIAVARGAPQPGDRQPGPLGYGPAAEAAHHRRGPVWFRKMDRNGDGDVSPAEFLGPAEQFRKIDADGDGLIDADEAERADALFRKKDR